MSDQTRNDTLECWAIVEMMGHQRIAGYVTTMTFGAACMFKVAVPATDGGEAYDRLISPASIFAINPVDEATARHFAERCRPAPLRPLNLSSPAAALPEPDDDFDQEL